MQARIDHEIAHATGAPALKLTAVKAPHNTDWTVRLDTPHEGLTDRLSPAECMELARFFVQLANMSGYSRRLR